MLEIIVYSDPVKDEAGVITKESTETLRVLFNKEDVMRVVREKLEPVDEGDPFEQLIIYMKYKVDTVRYAHKKNARGELSLKDGKPVIIETTIEDFDTYYVTDPAQVGNLYDALKDKTLIA